MGDEAIRVEHLSKRYGDIVAVDDVDFVVPRGSITALLGGNGAGKTTTIAMLLGLVEPSGGRIVLLGYDIARDLHRALARTNFSSPYVELPRRLTVAENLRIYGHLYGVVEVERRIAAVARDLALTEFLDRETGRLSAGQRTRVALGKALLNAPEVLLLDEPTASLDPDTADWVRGYLSDYRRRTGACILLASHNMAEVERMADNVVMMKQGRVVDRGDPAALLARYGRQNLEEVFLDVARGRRADGNGDGGPALL